MTDSMKQPIEQLNEKLKETFNGVVQLRTSVTIRGYKLDIFRPADAELQDYLRFEYVGWMTHKWPQKKDIQEHEYTNLYRPNWIRGYNIDIEAFKTIKTPPKFITADNGEYFVNKNLLTNDEEKGEILLRLLSQHDKDKDAFLTELQMVLHSKTPEVSKQIWADATSTNCPIYVKRPDVSNLDQSSEGLPVAYEEASWKKLLQKYVRVEQPKTSITCNALSFPSEDDIDRQSPNFLDLDSFKKRYDNSVLKAFIAEHTGQPPRPFIKLGGKCYMHANTITNEMEQELFTMYLNNKQEKFENITKAFFTAYQCHQVCSKGRPADESPCYERGQMPSNCKGFFGHQARFKGELLANPMIKALERKQIRYKKSPVDTFGRREQAKFFRKSVAPTTTGTTLSTVQTTGKTTNTAALQRAREATPKSQPLLTYQETDADEASRKEKEEQLASQFPPCQKTCTGDQKDSNIACFDKEEEVTCKNYQLSLYSDRVKRARTSNQKTVKEGAREKLSEGWAKKANMQKQFPLNQRVLIHNLQKRNDLNDTLGMVRKQLESGRLVVSYADGQQVNQVSVEPENLKKIEFTDAEEKYLSTFIDEFLRGNASISFHNQLVHIYSLDPDLNRRIGTIISVGGTVVPNPPNDDWKNPLPNVQVRLGPQKTVAVGLGQVSIIGLKPVPERWSPSPAGEVAPVVVGWPRPTPEEKSTQGPTKFGLITRFEPSTTIDKKETIGKAAIRWETQIGDFEERENLVPIEQLIVSTTRNNLCEIKCYKSPTPVGKDGGCTKSVKNSFNEVETTTCQEYERNERKPNPFKLRI